MPLPPLWTAVLGEHNRDIETGHERRVPIDKIITHNGYLNFQHDIGVYAWCASLIFSDGIPWLNRNNDSYCHINQIYDFDANESRTFNSQSTKNRFKIVKSAIIFFLWTFDRIFNLISQTDLTNFI